MLTLHLNRGLTLFLLVPLISNTISKSKFEEGLEIKAVSYFLNVIMKSNNEINFDTPKFTIGMPSKIYDIAFTLDKINLLKDSVTQKENLDKIEKDNNENSFLKRKMHLSSARKTTYDNGKKWGMTVYNAIEYEGKQYVEITLFNSKSNSEKIYCIEFERGVPQKCYTKQLVFD